MRRRNRPALLSGQRGPPDKQRKSPMGLKLSSIKISVSDEGEWVDVPEWPGVRLKVRSINARDYVQARDLMVQKKVKGAEASADVRRIGAGSWQAGRAALGCAAGKA
jgi:hypothetical protein